MEAGDDARFGCPHRGRTEEEAMIANTAPRSSRRTPDATCAWCRIGFSSIVDLLDHVDVRHLDTASTPDPELFVRPVMDATVRHD
jgi:hypothetical protein